MKLKIGLCIVNPERAVVILSLFLDYTFLSFMQECTRGRIGSFDKGQLDMTLCGTHVLPSSVLYCRLEIEVSCFVLYCRLNIALLVEILNNTIAHFDLSLSKLLLTILPIEMKYIVHSCQFHIFSKEFLKVVHWDVTRATLKLQSFITR